MIRTCDDRTLLVYWIDSEQPQKEQYAGRQKCPRLQRPIHRPDAYGDARPFKAIGGYEPALDERGDSAAD
jgi:hypothetical protein